MMGDAEEARPKPCEQSSRRRHRQGIRGDGENRSRKGALAGLAFAFALMRALHLSHLQVQAWGWMPVALWGLA